LNKVTLQIVDESRARANDITLAERRSASPISQSPPPSSATTTTTITNQPIQLHEDEKEDLANQKRLNYMYENVNKRTSDRKLREERWFQLRKRLEMSEESLKKEVDLCSPPRSPTSTKSIYLSSPMSPVISPSSTTNGDTNKLQHRQMYSSRNEDELEQEIVDAEALARSAQRRIEVIQEGIMRFKNESVNSLKKLTPSSSSKRRPKRKY
jgi:hypothetical protein